VGIDDVIWLAAAPSRPLGRRNAERAEVRVENVGND
jgi:hypothetical protein